MQLFSREYGSKGPTLVIIHGLYGASDNWVSVVRQLEQDYHVYLIDQRNHGQSPHDTAHTYVDMAADLLAFFTTHNIEKAHVVGHSMGGKTAMYFALTQPQLIDKLVILDIAPKSYASFSNYAQITNNHLLIIESMMKVDFSSVKSRQEVDTQLKQQLPDKPLRQFLLKNVERKKDGTYNWRLNLKAIHANLDKIMDGLSEQDHLPVQLPTVFIRGEQSGYVMDEDMLLARKFFPGAELVTIPKAGHWLHAEQPELLIKTLAYFLLD